MLVLAIMLGLALGLSSTVSYAFVSDTRESPGKSSSGVLPMDTHSEPTQAYPRASDFVLQDQHKRWHTYQFPRQKISFLALADQDGSTQLEAWIQPVYARYQDKIDIHGIAAMPDVPAALRGLVRLFFQGRLQYPVMLDWDSQVAQRYGYQHEQANLLVIDTQGGIRLRMIGPVEPGRLQRVFVQIDDLLRAGCGSDQNTLCRNRER